MRVSADSIVSTVANSSSVTYLRTRKMPGPAGPREASFAVHSDDRPVGMRQLAAAGTLPLPRTHSSPRNRLRPRANNPIAESAADSRARRTGRLHMQTAASPARTRRTRGVAGRLLCRHCDGAPRAAGDHESDQPGGRRGVIAFRRGRRTNQAACMNYTTALFADLVRAAQATRAGPPQPKRFTQESGRCSNRTRGRGSCWFVRRPPSIAIARRRLPRTHLLGDCELAQGPRDR
jgi:hypothetical protein